MPQLDISVWGVLAPYILSALVLFYTIFYVRFTSFLLGEIRKAFVTII